MSEPKPPKGTVGERIRGLLSERRMSQRQLAAALAGDGAPSNSVENMRRQISGWVNDQHVPSYENAEALAEQLGVSAEWFAAAPVRRSMSAALEEVAQVVDALREHVEAETARAEEATRIVRALDRRLEHNEALLRQLIEGQLSGTAALEAILERLDAGESGARGPHRRPGTGGRSG